MPKFTQLPEGPILRIASYLNDADLSSLSKTCRTFSFFTQSERPKRALTSLIAAVIDDKREKVAKILKLHPEFLLKTPHRAHLRYIESQYTWQKFYVESPLKIALIRNQVEMIKVMVPYLQQLPQEEVMAQWAQAEAVISQQKTTYDFDALIAAINTGGQDMEEALQAFRDMVLPQDPVTLNDYYNIEALLLAAYQAYADKFNDFADWLQRIIFCVRVIGFLQSLVTPEVAQVFCEGLYSVVEGGQAISNRARSLKLKLWTVQGGTTNFYRSNNRSLAGLGFEYLSHVGVAEYDSVLESTTLLEKLCRAKTSELAGFKDRLQCPVEPKPCCVIL